MLYIRIHAANGSFFAMPEHQQCVKIATQTIRPIAREELMFACGDNSKRD